MPRPDTSTLVEPPERTGTPCPRHGIVGGTHMGRPHRGPRQPDHVFRVGPTSARGRQTVCAVPVDDRSAQAQRLLWAGDPNGHRARFRRRIVVAVGVQSVTDGAVRAVRDVLFSRGCAGCGAPDEVLCGGHRARFRRRIVVAVGVQSVTDEHHRSHRHIEDARELVYGIGFARSGAAGVLRSAGYGVWDRHGVRELSRSVAACGARMERPWRRRMRWSVQ